MGLLIKLGAALGSWQLDAVLHRAVDRVEQLLQVGRLQLGRLAVLAEAAPGASLDEAGFKDLKLDEFVVFSQPDVPLPVALFSSQRLKLYRRDIVETGGCAKPDGKNIVKAFSIKSITSLKKI